jgi:heme/copper-type cytochrome/quinol oxidase subunit 2
LAVALYDFILGAATLVFVAVAGVMGWSIVRRGGRDGGTANAADRESVGRELLWWALPTLLMLLLFVLTIVRATRG